MNTKILCYYLSTSGALWVAMELSSGRLKVLLKSDYDQFLCELQNNGVPEVASMRLLNSIVEQD